MSSPEIVLVRHGQTEWSAAGWHAGRADVPFTDLGRRMIRPRDEACHLRSMDPVL